MNVHFTARKFKAHQATKDRAIESVKRLDRYYDGILRTDIILSFERSINSLKMAEINLHVHGAILTAKEKTEDFHKSIDLAVDKLERQLSKYKSKQRAKNKITMRRVKEKVTDIGDDE